MDVMVDYIPPINLWSINTEHAEIRCRKRETVEVTW